MPVRKLALRRETLADLSTHDLRDVAGGSHTCTTSPQLTRYDTCDRCRFPTVPYQECLSLDGQICSDGCTA